VRAAPAHENQRHGKRHAAGEAGQQEPSALGELHGDGDDDRDQRQTRNADDLHGREVDSNRRKLLAHDSSLHTTRLELKNHTALSTAAARTAEAR
jgi:hypothetical protein